jgi:thymidylate synthase (FAD)
MKTAKAPGNEADQADLSPSETFNTKRPTVPAMEAILFDQIDVLDHGFIRVVDYMGDDAAIVQAARVSYGKGTKKVSEDNGLIRYLLSHQHTTPFEMASVKLHVKLPIFVARQWIRHRTASVNEYSARYSVLDNEFYVPKLEHLAAQSKSNRQGRAEILSPQEADFVLKLLSEDASRNYDHYLQMLNEGGSKQENDPNRKGLSRELARINLTLNTYTQWYWKTDLHNLLHFVRLRADAHAQLEIRAYANVLLDILEKWVPMTTAAFHEYRMGATTLSRTATQLLKAAIKGDNYSELKSKLPTREWDELSAKFDLK